MLTEPFALEHIPSDALLDELLRREEVFAQTSVRLAELRGWAGGSGAPGQTPPLAALLGRSEHFVANVVRLARMVVGPDGQAHEHNAARSAESVRAPGVADATSSTATRSRGRPYSESTALIVDVLRRSGRPLQPADLIPLLRAEGWATRSPRPQDVVRRYLVRAAEHGGLGVVAQEGGFFVYRTASDTGALTGSVGGAGAAARRSGVGTAKRKRRPLPSAH